MRKKTDKMNRSLDTCGAMSGRLVGVVIPERGTHYICAIPESSKKKGERIKNSNINSQNFQNVMKILNL